MLSLLKSVLTSLLQIAAVLPLLLLIKLKYSKKQKQLLLFAGLVLVAEGIIASEFNFDFIKTQWNWTGKSASMVAAILFIHFNSVLSKQAIGFTNSLKVNSTYPALGFSSLLLFLKLIPKIISGNFHQFNGFETFAYQATLPGFSEELIYRGILLGLLNKVYPASISILKARIGWGVLIVAVIFGLVHGINFDKHWQLLFNSQKFCMTMGLGLAFAWLKQRSGSLLPSVIFHNLWNLIVVS